MKIEALNLSCGYDGRSVVSNIDFSVESGEICCILGPNGVGKTTLFRTLLKLQKPIDGRVMIDGQDISKWSTKKMAQYTAYVSQYHTPPFPYIVKDVILLGRVSSTGYFGQPKEVDYEIVDRVMAEMNIEHLKDKAYTDISGGERQLVMIARALAQEPKMLVLDEPTASLDYGNMIKVMRCINGLKEKGYGIIMTTHMPDQAFMCDSKVVLLQKSCPPVFGKCWDVVTPKNLYSAYGVEVRVFQYKNRKGKMVRICSPNL